MNQRLRLFLFILLNIFVSACVTSAILFWYDRTHRSVPSSPGADPGGVLAVPLGTEVATTPDPDATIEIMSIIGAGVLDTEVVLIKNTGPTAIQLAGWRLQDSNGNVFTFPQLTLNRDGAVQVYTAAGINTVVELYWGRNQAVWQSGEIATLIDAKSNIRAIFRIP